MANQIDLPASQERVRLLFLPGRSLRQGKNHHSPFGKAGSLAHDLQCMEIMGCRIDSSSAFGMMVTPSPSDKPSDRPRFLPSFPGSSSLELSSLDTYIAR